MDCEKWLEKLLRTEGTILCDDVRIRALKNGFTRKELKSARKKVGRENISPNDRWYDVRKLVLVLGGVGHDGTGN